MLTALSSMVLNKQGQEIKKIILAMAIKNVRVDIIERRIKFFSYVNHSELFKKAKQVKEILIGYEGSLPVKNIVFTQP